MSHLYYARHNGIPHEWLKFVAHNFETIGPQFNTHRMVQEYCTKFYSKASEQGMYFTADNFALAKNLAAWKQNVNHVWHKVYAKNVNWNTPNSQKVSVGDQFGVTAEVYLDTLKSDEVLVEVYAQGMDSRVKPCTYPLIVDKELGDNWYLFKGEVDPRDSGSYGFNVRVLPNHPGLLQKQELRLTTWASS
jgi:starch phosphorylase